MVPRNSDRQTGTGEKDYNFNLASIPEETSPTAEYLLAGGMRIGDT